MYMCMYVAMLLRFRIASCDLHIGLQFRNVLRFRIMRLCYTEGTRTATPIYPTRGSTRATGYYMSRKLND